MKRTLLVLLSFELLSFGPYAEMRHPALLTESYGIIKKFDLEAEDVGTCHTTTENHSSIPAAARARCATYWQCLPTTHLYMDCRAPEDGQEEGQMFRPVFWIANGGDVHHFSTRRSFPRNICFDQQEEWKAILQNSDTVCVLAGFSYKTTLSDEDGPEGDYIHHHWIIDRLKTHNKVWSYFTDAATGNPLE